MKDSRKSAVPLSWWRRWMLNRIAPRETVLIPVERAITAVIDKERRDKARDEAWALLGAVYLGGNNDVNEAITRVIRWTVRKLEDLESGREEPW